MSRCCHGNPSPLDPKEAICRNFPSLSLYSTLLYIFKDYRELTRGESDGLLPRQSVSIGSDGVRYRHFSPLSLLYFTVCFLSILRTNTQLRSSQKPLANLRDWRRLSFEANTRPHFIWDDNQLPIRGSQTKKHNIIVEGKKTSLYVRRGPCEGVKTCAGPDCEYVVSNRQKINRCLRHRKN